MPSIRAQGGCCLECGRRDHRAAARRTAGAAVYTRRDPRCCCCCCFRSRPRPRAHRSHRTQVASGCGSRVSPNHTRLLAAQSRLRRHVDFWLQFWLHAWRQQHQHPRWPVPDRTVHHAAACAAHIAHLVTVAASRAQRGARVNSHWGWRPGHTSGRLGNSWTWTWTWTCGCEWGGAGVSRVSAVVHVAGPADRPPRAHHGAAGVCRRVRQITTNPARGGHAALSCPLSLSPFSSFY